MSEQHTRPDQQYEINELCRQTWHVDDERQLVLRPIMGERSMGELSEAEADQVIEALVELRDRS